MVREKKEKLLYGIWKSTIGLKIYFNIEKNCQNSYVGVVIEDNKGYTIGKWPNQNLSQPSLALCALDIGDLMTLPWEF